LGYGLKHAAQVVPPIAVIACKRKAAVNPPRLIFFAMVTLVVVNA